MKSIGIVRKVDELGRVVLPMELRRTLDINPRDPLEIYIDGESIILMKYEPQCVFCSQSGDMRVFRDKNVCQECLKEMADSIDDTMGE